MTRPFRILTLLLSVSSIVWISGCGLGSTVTSAIASPDLTGNWQFQSASNISTTTPPTAGVLLVGALQSNGSHVTGTFRFANLALPNSCGTPLQQVITLSGSIDSSRNLTLTSAPFTGSVVQLSVLVPPVVTGIATGTIQVTGMTCSFPSSQALGLEFPAVTGTYAGTLAATTGFGTPPSPTASVSLKIVQSTSPAADGQFPVTGSLQFSGGTCTSTTALTGTVSGSEVMASSAATGLLPGVTSLVAVINPVMPQVYTNVTFLAGPCATGLLSFTGYQGSLTKQ